MSNAPQARPPVAPILRVRHAGDWAADRLTTAWAASTRDVPPAARRLIDDAWERATLEPNRSLFDGPMCRLEACAVYDDDAAAAAGQPGDGKAGGGRVRLGLSPTSYKEFWGTNMTHPELADRFGPAVLADPVGVSPALETADGFLLLGRRNREVAYYPARVHPFAGCLEPADGGGPADKPGAPAAGSPGPDPFAAVLRELAEELNLTAGEVGAVRLTGVVEDVRLRQPELIFRVQSALPRAAIEARLDAAEHRSAVAVPATDAEVAVAVRRPELTPVAVAALLLWGRVRFGPAWYAAAAAAANVVA